MHKSICSRHIPLFCLTAAAAAENIPRVVNRLSQYGKFTAGMHAEWERDYLLLKQTHPPPALYANEAAPVRMQRNVAKRRASGEKNGNRTIQFSEQKLNFCAVGLCGGHKIVASAAL